MVIRKWANNFKIVNSQILLILNYTFLTWLRFRNNYASALKRHILHEINGVFWLCVVMKQLSMRDFNKVMNTCHHLHKWSTVFVFDLYSKDFKIWYLIREFTSRMHCHRVVNTHLKYLYYSLLYVNSIHPHYTVVDCNINNYVKSLIFSLNIQMKKINETTYFY